MFNSHDEFGEGEYFEAAEEYGDFLAQVNAGDFAEVEAGEPENDDAVLVANLEQWNDECADGGEWFADAFQAQFDEW